MKSPADLAAKLAHQWQNADLREQRLLSANSWPLRLSIGKPNGRAIAEDLNKVRQHLQRWRNVSVGKVEWQPHRFRDASEDIDVPLTWILHSPSEWIEAANNSKVRLEYQCLCRLVSEVSTIEKRYLPAIIRKRRLVLDKPENEVVQAARLTSRLTPGYAEGKPLRALSVAGIDSKFFERNRQLIIQMLDILFDDQVSEQGLEVFLNAEDEGHHWLLIVDLDGQLLPFSQLRVRAQELIQKALPGTAILIIENERCLHQLPKLENTIAILGAGLNLTWMRAAWLKKKKIAYWGDIDTWGLTMLARARLHQPELRALLMDQATFEYFSDGRAVPEPQRAETIPATGLTFDEVKLYDQLSNSIKGRLEQEFLPQSTVSRAVADWTRSAV